MPVDKHSDLRMLRQRELPNILKKHGRAKVVSYVRKEAILAFTYFVYFCIILATDHRTP